MRMNLWQPMILHRGIAQRHLPALSSHLRDINPRLNLFVMRGKKFQYLLVLNSIRLFSTGLTIPCVGQCYWPRRGTSTAIPTVLMRRPSSLTTRLREQRRLSTTSHSIDETPKFVDNPSSGTAPIEHYVRRLVIYLARLQSVTQKSEKGLNLKAYVKLDTKQWLRMYSRIHHACEIAACIHLPDPIMLTAAAMVRSDSDLSVDSDPERSSKALRAIRNVQTEMGLGGKPDAAAARAQTTILATDFDLCANNRVTRNNMTLGQTLRNKGWGELIHINPCFMNSYTCEDSMGVDGGNSFISTRAS
eukprot:s1447_g12.t1